MNPSVINYGGRLLVNLRCVNYYLHHSENSDIPNWGGIVQYIHGENDVRLSTENIIAELDNGLNITSLKYVSLPPVESKWDFHGLEDIRLVSWSGILHAVGVRRDWNDQGCGRIWIHRLNESFDSYIAEDPIKVQSPSNVYCEKNWMPIEEDPGKLIRLALPTNLVEIGLDGTIGELSKNNLPHSYDMARGSSQVIKYKDNYIAIVHYTRMEKPLGADKDADYDHQLLMWDSNFQLINKSEKFKFTDTRIEFCCGMAFHPDGDLLISFSIMDNSSNILKVDTDWLINELLG